MNRGAYLYSSLVSQYQKLHILMQMENCGDFFVFLGAFIKQVMADRKKGQNGHFCSGTTRLHERLGEL